MKIIIAAITMTALMVAGPVFADEPVAVGGEMLFVLKAESDLGKSSAVRASDCYDRMRYILGDSQMQASDIRAKPLENYGVKIVARGKLIAVIGAEEAKAHGVTMTVLSRQWVETLRSKLSMLRARPDLALGMMQGPPLQKRALL